jgi:thiamine pyrophosphokinase
LSTSRRAIIFANGVLNHPEAVRDSIQSDDLIIAADGGGRLCRKLGLIPNVLIGDFDSLDEEDLSYFSERGAEIIRFPTRKDFTDLELALLHCRSLAIQEVTIFAALGARWDQTLANLLLPAASILRGMHIRLVDGPQEVRLMREGQESVVRGRPGDTLSLIPVGGDVQGVTTQGLEYPLQGETLYLGATRGLSNVFLGETALVKLKEGILLCVVIRKEDGG